AVAIGDRERVAEIHGLLSPYADRTIMIGPSFFCQGSVARGLGVTAGALGRWDEAMAHFEMALAVHRSMGAAPYVAFTERDREAVLRARDGSDGHPVQVAATPAVPTARLFPCHGNVSTVASAHHP